MKWLGELQKIVSIKNSSLLTKFYFIKTKQSQITHCASRRPFDPTIVGVVDSQTCLKLTTQFKIQKIMGSTHSSTVGNTAIRSLNAIFQELGMVFMGCSRRLGISVSMALLAHHSALESISKAAATKW